jgi:octaprenyl-diphosphate synthase
LIFTNNLKTTESQYLDIISDKTAQLFSAACKISAEICEIEEEKKDFLSDFGKFIGIAYQIVDDTLDYFYKSDESGKEPGNDLKEKKMTLPLILSYQRGNIKEKRIIESILLKNDITKLDFEKIVNIMEKYNIKSDCLAKAKHFSIMAKDSLGIFKESPAKEKILKLVDFLINRKN